ncbi:MAG: polysaccharide biosynthesis protein [Sulfurovaceae bacterium]|nr:polysaccharide biosynthesis protein [Sulfurovaceae bacterium]
MSIDKIFQPTNNRRTLFFITVDIIISFFTIFLAYLLRFSFDIPAEYIDSMIKMMVILIPIKITILFMFNIYFIAWRFFGLSEYKRIIMVHFWVYLFFIGVVFLYYEILIPFPRSVVLIDLSLSLFLIGFVRISKRLYLESITPKFQKKMLIVGVNDTANHLIKSASRGEIEYYPVALVSKEKSNIGTYFSNIKVYEQGELTTLIEKLEVQSVVLTEKMEQKELDYLFTILNLAGIKDIKRTQIFEDDTPALSDISIEDLLARQPQDLDRLSIANFIIGKVVMITGAGGSIGSELARQVKMFGAKQIILLDNCEYNLYAINEELNHHKSVCVMQDIKNRVLLEKTFAMYRPDILIHAAAYKHVPLCEENIKEAIDNNVFGTKNVIDLSVLYGVSKVVLISTDKAVRPTNVMGATKRICEIYANAIPSKETEIVAVRFGNVLGSSGSVIPKFKSQIERGENLTVTHTEITRYFMMIPEACQLVLQAASIANGRELFILDMGKPIKIMDLAKKMIELSGQQNIGIDITGLRKGEKLYEELLINEADLKTEYCSIMVTQDVPFDYQILLERLENLKENDNNLLEKLKVLVPEFNHHDLQYK